MEGTIKSGLFRRLKSRLFALGFNIAEQTPESEVRSLIQSLWPVDCGVDLIRIGGSGDGAYLIPDDLKGIEYCFSPGVNTISNFENQLADLQIRSFMADYSVDAPPEARPQFTFDKKFLGASDTDTYMTLESWKNKYLRDYSGDLILQMDIESYEYEVIFATPDSLLNQFRIMAIEFHNMQMLFDPFAFKLMSSCFEKILKYFHVVHIHPNNCGVVLKRGSIEIPESLEFTFLNKRRASATTLQTSFPHKLDVDNTTRWRSVPLPECWHAPVGLSASQASV